MVGLHVGEHPNDLKHIGDKGITGELDVGDAGLKKMFTSSSTPIINIWEHRPRDFFSCGGRDVTMGH